MKALRRIAVVAVALAALAAAPAATPTTAPSQVVVLTVTLTATKVQFTPQPSILRGSTVRFTVFNASPVRRTFTIVGKVSRTVKPHSGIMFFLQFPERGAVAYTSAAAKHTTLKGVFRVG